MYQALVNKFWFRFDKQVLVKPKADKHAQIIVVSIWNWMFFALIQLYCRHIVLFNIAILTFCITLSFCKYRISRIKCVVLILLCKLIVFRFVSFIKKNLYIHIHLYFLKMLFLFDTTFKMSSQIALETYHDILITYLQETKNVHIYIYIY